MRSPVQRRWLRELAPEQVIASRWQHDASGNLARDETGRACATDEDVMIGGDFCEKQIIHRMIDGKVRQIRRKGWQIDPKTGQRIEMDF